MNKLKILTVTFLSAWSMNAQNNLDCLQGYWEMMEPSRVEADKYYYQLLIIKNNSELTIGGLEQNWDYVNEKRIGFVNTLNEEEITESMITNQGAYLISYNSGFSLTNGISMDRLFYCDEFLFSSGNASTIDFGKVEKLPYSTYEFLFSKGKENNRKYFDNYFIQTVRSICVPTLTVYDTSDGHVVGTVEQGELVEILQDTTDWVQIKSLKTELTGWIYDSCLE